jgi:hypothetical protein
LPQEGVLLQEKLRLTYACHRKAWPRRDALLYNIGRIIRVDEDTHQGNPSMTSDPETVAKLDELLAAIRGYDDPRRAAAEWKLVFKLLQKAQLPSAQVAGIVGMRDVGRLSQTIDQLRPTDGAAAAAPAGADVPDSETCKRALTAFRKRSALTRLDEESKISSHSPLSKGKQAHAAAIVLPDEWPQPVWDELVRQGKIRNIGHGFYEETR